MKDLYLPQITTQTVWAVIGEPGPALAIWLVLSSILAFFQMHSDKQRSQTRGARRIPERRLFLTAALGGSAGAMLGMLLFRHKTQKWYFALGMPLLLTGQVLLLLYLF